MRRYIASNAFGATIKTLTLIFVRKVEGRERSEQAHEIETYVYLINSRFGLVDFEFTDHFPRLVSYNVQDKEDDELTRKPMKLLTLEFEKGSLSIIYEAALHAISKQPLAELDSGTHNG